MNPSVKSEFIQDLCFALFFWSLLIAVGGYEVGIGDQAEFLPYSLYIYNKTLYPFDLYIQGMEAMAINERYFFVHLLSFLVPVLEPSVLFLHVLFTIILITGILRFGRHYIENRFLLYLVVLFALVITKGLQTGGNEIYYNNFQGSNIAKGLCMWGLVFLIERKWALLCLFTIIATLFQPMVGFHFFLLSTAASAYRTFIEKEGKIINLALYILAFSATGGFYIMAIKFAQGQQIIANLSDSEFINIAYYFCMPHHFIPSYLSKKGILLSLPLLAASIYYYSSKEKSIFVFLLTMLSGILIYIIGTYAFDSFLVMSSWWFRTTIWIKIIGFTAVAGIITSHYKIKAYNKFKEVEKYSFICISIVLICCVTTFPETIPHNRYHLIKNAVREADAELCREIKKKVHKNAVFIQPALFSALKYYGEKSSYVEYLTPARRKDYLKIWYQRIKEVYHVRYEDIPVNTFMLKTTDIRTNLIKQMDDNFMKHTKESLSILKAKGVTHIITFKDHFIKDLEVIAENNEFKVYKL
jgi:hypothetical protein